jgi:hypothetical protein
MKSFKTLFGNPDESDAKDVATSVRETSLWVVLFVLIIVKALLWFLGLDIPFENSQLYLMQSGIRVGMSTFPVAILRSFMVLGIGLVAAQWIENTLFGQRLGSNRVFLFGAIMIAVALAFGLK